MVATVQVPTFALIYFVVKFLITRKNKLELHLTGCFSSRTCRQERVGTYAYSHKFIDSKLSRFFELRITINCDDFFFKLSISPKRQVKRVTICAWFTPQPALTCMIDRLLIFFVTRGHLYGQFRFVFVEFFFTTVHN